MTTTKEYLDAMNQLDETFEPDDRKYFIDLREYMTTASFFKDEQAINEQLYQMYLDFLNADKEGFTAEEFFGNNPKEMADQLLEQLPKTSFKKLLRYIGITAMVIWSIRLIFDFSHSIEVIINPALYILDLILVFSLIMLLFKSIKHSVFRKSSNRSTNLFEGIVAGLIFIFYIFVYLKSDQFIPEILTFSISYPWDIFIILGICLTAIFFGLRTQDKNFYPMIFTIFIFSLIGIDKRLVAYGGIQIPSFIKILILIALGITIVFSKRKLDKN